MNGKLLSISSKLLAKNAGFSRIKHLFSRRIELTLFFCALFISSISFAQVGPAGVNTGIEFWLDASDLDGDGNVEGALEGGIVPGDSSITEWRDKSGVLTGGHFTPPSSTFDTPKYRPLEAGFDGLTTVEFGASSALSHIPAISWSGNHTVFVVFKQKGVAVPTGTSLFANGVGLTSAASLDSHFRIGADVGTAGLNFSYYTSADTETTPIFSESTYDTQVNALAGISYYSATRTVDTVTTYVNGTANPVVTLTTSGDLFDHYLLNANRDTSLTNDCYIAEVIVYSRVLNASELSRVHNYLDCKYTTPFLTESPGGIEPCFVSLWLKADEGVTEAGPNVTTWTDQGAHGFDGTASGAPGPSFVENVNNFNPAINFDASVPEALQIFDASSLDGLMLGTSDFSIYAVASQNSGTDGTLFADNRCLLENGYRVKFNNTNNNWRFLGGTTNGSIYLDSSTVETSESSTSYSLLNIKRSGLTHTAQTNEGDVNTGTSVGTLSFTSPNNGSPTQRWIGREFGSCSGMSDFDGNLSEIIVIRSTVSSNRDIQIQSYLGLKYGLTLNSSLSNYLSSDGTVLWNDGGYWFDVAGIGRDLASGLDQRVSKSQDSTAIITIATTDTFTVANSDPIRTSLADGSFLVWGNNNVAASGAWAISGAPSDYAILPEVWKVKETGTVAGVSIQVDVNDTDNDMPGFLGDLYFVTGSDLSMATPVVMTEDSPGIWSISGVDLVDNDLFSFAVLNKLEVEFTSLSESSDNETTVGPFPEIIATGTLNVASSFDITGTGLTATSGTDFTFPTQTFPVAANIYHIDTFYLTEIGLPGDLMEEPNETVLLSIISSPGTSPGDADTSGSTNTFHTYTIVDDDSYIVSIGFPTTGLENSTDVTFKIYVVGTNNSPSIITGDLSWTGGTAMNTVDFTGPPNFSIPIGVDTITINVPYIDDGLLEGTETITATISNLMPGVVGSSSATADLDDDEVSGIFVSIDNATDALEGSPITFEISLPTGIDNNSGSPITGTVSFGGSAIDGTDFSGGGPASFSILQGTNFTTVSYPTIPDVSVEVAETVIATIALTNGIGMEDPAATIDTAYIFDEDTIGLTMSLSAVANGVVEGGSNIVYEVELDGGKINETGSPIMGTLTLTGTASSPSDYANQTTFSIPDGSGIGVITIIVADDMIAEADETLIATISAPNLGTINGANNGITVNIQDDDSGGLFISIGPDVDTATEGTGSPVSFKVFVEGGGMNASGGAITGSIIYSGTATSTGGGADFTPVYGFSIPNGGDTVTITLPIIDDGNSEPTETIQAILSGTPTVGSYTNTTSTASIIDDDASSLTMSIGTPLNGVEGGDSVKFTVSLDNMAVNGTGGPIVGNLDFSASVAVPGTDFTVPAPSVFSIPAGQSSTTIILPVNNDGAVEYSESVVAVISSPSIGMVSAADTSIANILDDDFGTLTLSISSPMDGTEGAVPADGSFLISMDGLTNGLGEPLTGTLAFSGTATPGADFSSAPTFSIPEGAPFVTYDIGVNDDLFLEQTEKLIVTITGALVGDFSAVNTDSLEIFDNDLGTAELTISTTVHGIESATAPVNAEFKVSFVGGLQNQTGSPITGDITVDPTSTATDGQDFNSVPTFSIPDGASFIAVPFDVVDDPLEEPTETIIAIISGASAGNIGAQNTATADISDDDTDTDNDGLPDLLDSNDVNIDTDCDGIFDGCDADADGDGMIDFGLTDTDGDGIHDGCDADADGDGTIDNGPDINNDGLNDVEWDPTDDDGDLLPNHVDPNDNNPDTDGDGIPDGADVDVNGDGIFDNGCDVDDDGVHNVADSDDSPKDGQTDVGNLDEDLDGIDNQWDLVNDNAGGQAINYIVSPNNDNVNETLRISGIDFFDNHSLTIYNRWGVVIYQSRDYQQNWAGEMEEGVIIGSEPIIEGTYFYTLDLGNGEEFVRGYIEIRN